MAYSRFSRRRPYARRRRSYSRRSYSSYSRPRRSYRVGIFRRRRSTKRVRSNRVQAQDGCGPCKSELSAGDKFIIAQADPFLPKAFGGKIPDSSTLPSVATPLQWNQSLTSATGTTQPMFAHAWAFYPSVTGSFVTGRGLTPSTWTWVGTGSSVSNAPQRTNFLTAFEATRTVAHGIRLSCPQAPTTTTGFVHIAIATETTWAGGAPVPQYTQLATSTSEMSGYTFYKRVTLSSLTQTPLTLVNKWTDETAFRYQSPEPNAAEDATTTGNTFTIPYSWGTLLIAVEGVSVSTTPGNTVTPLQAEVILHTENIPQKTGSLIGSMAAAYDSATLNAVSRATAGSDFAHTESDQDSFIGSYMGDVAAAVTEAGERIAPAVQTFMRTAGRNMVEGAVNAAGQFIFGVGGVNNLPNRIAIM